MRRLLGMFREALSSLCQWSRNYTHIEPDTALAATIPLLILLYLFLAPYTKVEESFNIQATHDILTYGLPIKQVAERLRDQYDHLTFTGSVPRTFVGPLALAAVSYLPSWFLEGLDKQILGKISFTSGASGGDFP